MVFVKVRETYDLHTVQNKMTVIGIHTPNPEIIKKSYPGLLMQCKSYRPFSCDVRVACASVLPLDPLGVGTAEGDVSPEDVFNPILYKAMSNFGMSQLEARINGFYQAASNADISGPSAVADIDSFLDASTDQFKVYYGLLSNTHEWRHANPQQGLSMEGLRPLVHEINYAFGDNAAAGTAAINYPNDESGVQSQTNSFIIGGSKPMPFINTTAYSYNGAGTSTFAQPGFTVDTANSSTIVPWLQVFVGCIIVPPSRLHQLFYRMVVEWTIEFSTIRPLGDLTTFGSLGKIGDITHFMSYDYSNTKKAVIGEDQEEILENDTCMVASNVDINKVM